MSTSRIRDISERLPEKYKTIKPQPLVGAIQLAVGECQQPPYSAIPALRRFAASFPSKFGANSVHDVTILDAEETFLLFIAVRSALLSVRSFSINPASQRDTFSETTKKSMATAELANQNHEVVLIEIEAHPEFCVDGEDLPMPNARTCRDLHLELDLIDHIVVRGSNRAFHDTKKRAT